MFSAREEDGTTAEGLGFKLDDEKITGPAFSAAGLEAIAKEENLIREVAKPTLFHRNALFAFS